MDYETYVKILKSKLMDFDFEDCPPVKELVDALVDFYLTNDDDAITIQPDIAIALLQQWKQHAIKVLKAEENS